MISRVTRASSEGIPELEHHQKPPSNSFPSPGVTPGLMNGLSNARESHLIMTCCVTSTPSLSSQQNFAQMACCPRHGVRQHGRCRNPNEHATWKDIPYAQVGDLLLPLDLYRSCFPTNQSLDRLGHTAGLGERVTKSSMPLQGLVAEGYAIASVDYRLTTQAKFPANVHDIKAAIRFLRAKGPSLGMDAEQIVIAGASAGGHLAALVGVTNDHAALEGTIGDQLETSSSVQG